MLHVLLLILKIIGIIIALLVGIVVLLVCILLFMPIKYQVKASYENSLDSLFVLVKVSWIFRLIRGFFSYKNKNMSWEFKIAWKELMNENEEPSKSETTPREVPEEVPEEVLKEVSKEVQDIEKAKPQGVEVEPSTIQKVTPLVDEEPTETIINPKKSKFSNKTKNWYDKIIGVYHKIIKRIKNIKYTILKIYANIKLLLTKKDKMMEFLMDDIHKSAFTKLKQELLKFLKKLKPKKFILSGIFGFEDPSLTGKVLAGLSVLYPFVGAHIQMMPDFEEQILQGDLYIKGKIRLSYIVLVAIRLLLNKDVRKTIKDVRQLKQ